MSDSLTKGGACPVHPSHRNYSFERTFGAIEPLKLPDEYDVDLGLTMPDQNADGYPMGCTGYTQAEVAGDEDGLVYDPAFTYKKTLQIEFRNEGDGCTVTGSIRSTRVYGLQAKGETTDNQALEHRRGQYFDVDRVGDYFGGMQSAMWLNRLNRRSISMAGPWMPNWVQVKRDGILEDFTYSGRRNDYGWHNFKCSGWTAKKVDGSYIAHGEIFLKLKAWQGKDFGDHGWVYMSRDRANKFFKIAGTSAFTFARANPEDIKLVRLSILETLVSYYIELKRRLAL